jgi:hypothetical protein
MQTWLPAEIAWNPAKREIKCILRFLEDVEVGGSKLLRK